MEYVLTSGDHIKHAGRKQEDLHGRSDIPAIWERVEKFSGNKHVVLRVAVPARTAKHKQAAVHTVWSTSHELIFYGFRNIDGQWICVAASDERKRGRIINAR